MRTLSYVLGQLAILLAFPSCFALLHWELFKCLEFAFALVSDAWLSFLA